MEQLDESLINQASLKGLFDLLTDIGSTFVKSARYALTFAPKTGRNFRSRLVFRLLAQRNLVKAVAVVVNPNWVLADDANELAMMTYAWKLALDLGVWTVVGHHKWKLASHVLQLLFSDGASNNHIVRLG